jgi:hypothetical protein
LPPVFAPGVGQAIMSGVIGVQPWASILHFRPAVGTPTWTVTQIQQLADSCWTGWGSTLTTLASTNVKLSAVSTVDIGSATGAAGSHTGTPVAGVAGTALEPSSLCTTIQYKINARYRGGHPRGYWPFGNTSLMLDESEWSTSNINAVDTNFPNFIDGILSDLNTAGISGALHCVPRYTYSYTYDSTHHKVIKTRTGYNGAPQVVNWLARKTVGSQRRRLTN